MNQSFDQRPAQEAAMDAAQSDGLRLRRVAGGCMVRYQPLFSLDGSLLFVIYESSIQAFSVATGDLVRSYESRLDDKHLIGMALDCTQKKFIYGCSVDGFLLSWKLDSGLLAEKIPIMTRKFVAESFNILYDQNGVSSFLIHETSAQQLFIQYCPHKRVILRVVQPAIHKDNVKSRGKTPVVPERSKYDTEGVRIVVAPGGYGLDYFAYIAQNRWYWVRLKPSVYINSMPHCKGVRPVVLACHPSEPVLAVGDESGLVVVYRHFLTRTNAKIISEEYHWHPYSVQCIAFSYSGTHLYSGGRERVLVKWRIGQQEKADLIPRLADTIVNVVVGPENLKLVLCTADNGIQIINALHKLTATIQSFSKVSVDLPQDELFPAGLRVNPRTYAIIMNGKVGCIQFFSTHSKSMIYTMDITMRNYNTNEDHSVIYNTLVTNIAVNTHWLATVENWNDYHNSMETRLKFWRYNESRQIYSLTTNLENVHQGGVHDIVFSSSSRERDLQCATAGKDHLIKVWSLEEIETSDGNEKLVWACVGTVGHRNLPVRSISFSQDASLLAGGFGNVLCIWNPDTLKLKCALSAPSGYDGCVNRALMILRTAGTKRQIPQKAPAQYVYDDARSKIISEIVALLNGKGKCTLFDNATEKCVEQQCSIRMQSVRNELIECVSDSQKKYIVERIRTNSKMDIRQRAELLQALRIACRANEEIKPRMLKKLLASTQSARRAEQYLQKMSVAYRSMKNAKPFPVIRKQRNYERRRSYPALFRNGLTQVFLSQSIGQMNSVTNKQSCEAAQDINKETLNPMKSFAQIQNVLFCHGQFAHLVVISTENRLVVWNLLSLKIQVSAALTIDRIALDRITNLIAAFTKENELFVFLPNISMPLYHRTSMPKVYGAVWVPRRYPSSQSFNVDWQATSQLFFLNEKQELQHLVSDNDKESVGPIDSDDEETSIVEEYVNKLSAGSKTPFAAMLAKQADGTKIQRNTILRSGMSSKILGKSVVRDIVASCSHTMAPVNLLCKDFLRALLVSVENRSKEGKMLNDNPAINNETTNSAFCNKNARNNETEKKKKIMSRRASAGGINQTNQNQTITTAGSCVQLGKLSNEIMDVVF